MPTLTKPVRKIAASSAGNYVVTATAEAVFTAPEMKCRRHGLWFRADANLRDVDIEGVGGDTQKAWYTMGPPNVAYPFESRNLAPGDQAQERERLNFRMVVAAHVLNVDAVGPEEFKVGMTILPSVGENGPAIEPAGAESDLVNITMPL